jgi:hypothetical protein
LASSFQSPDTDHQAKAGTSQLAERGVLMRPHPPEMLFWMVPAAILSGITYTISEMTGSWIAWTIAIVSGGLCVGGLLFQCFFLWMIQRQIRTYRRQVQRPVLTEEEREGFRCLLMGLGSQEKEEVDWKKEGF